MNPSWNHATSMPFYFSSFQYNESGFRCASQGVPLTPSNPGYSDMINWMLFAIGNDTDGFPTRRRSCGFLKTDPTLHVKQSAACTLLQPSTRARRSLSHKVDSPCAWRRTRKVTDIITSSTCERIHLFCHREAITQTSQFFTPDIEDSGLYPFLWSSPRIERA